MSLVTYTVRDLARPSGGLAMLAVDQREAMRLMFEAATGVKPISDKTITDFKVTAARILSPYASAVLCDKQFCLDEIVKTKAIAPSSSLIVSGDEFIPGNGIPVDDVAIDKAVDAQAVREMGGKALKLLVLYRTDESSEARLSMVAEFVKKCRSAGLVSIIEPVVRPPRHSAAFDKEACILAAAKELGDTEADIYKVEMPYGGRGEYKKLVEATAKLNDLIKMPWVILSSGVDANLFPRAVRAAMQSGASGFLAGRAVWANVVGLPDTELMLQDLAVPRLKRLGEIVDEMMARR